MGDPLSTLAVAAIAFLCTGIFFFSLAEAALLGANRQLIGQRARDGDGRAQLLQALFARGDYLTTLILGMNASIILISTIATLLVHHRLGHGAALVREIVHLATIATIMVLAELTPKTYASRYADDLAPAVAPAIAWLSRALGPAVGLVTAIGSGVMRLLRVPALHEKDVITHEDIMAAADLGEEAGLVEPEEGQLVDRIMELGELTARDAMTPRVDVVAVPENAGLQDVLDAAAEHGFSRLPVYRDTIDHVVGVVLVNDLLRCVVEGGDWREHIREPLIVAETAPLTDVFSRMRSARTHMAIVADEFGGTAGIITIEDILEELVGEIRDEHDWQETDIVQLPDGQLIVSGRARLDEVYEKLGRELPEEEETETVAGLLAELTGRIPEVGESVEHEGLTFVVEESDAQHVSKVRVFASDAHQGGDE